jgi:hypothetical protein
MTTEAVDKSTRLRIVWLGAALLLVITAGGAMARRALGPGSTLPIAAAYGLGTFAMAWLTARVAPYPRWAWIATAGVMAFGLLISAVALPGSEAKEWHTMAWMFPWLFLALSGVSPRVGSGVCTTAGLRGGLMLLGIGMLYVVLLLGAPLVSRLFS